MIEVKNTFNLVKTSYDKNDVIILLKDLSDKMTELPTEEREKLIQNGVHYSEMLPMEKEPSYEYLKLYNESMDRLKYQIAVYIKRVAEMVLANTTERCKRQPVLISLARAGIPIGILIKRYIKEIYNIQCSHYAISIIRDKGIDVNAMNYIYNNECNREDGNLVSNFIFVDGWTGKGAIKTQLTEAVNQLKESDKKWKDLKDDLFVLADPANITEFCGTHEDFLIPSSCLNSTISGLVSRTILNSQINTKLGDFHGAVYFEKFEDEDISNAFINQVTRCFLDVAKDEEDDIKVDTQLDTSWNGMTIVNRICNTFDVEDYKKVKPGIGETTRVLLRRIPWLILVDEKISENDPDIQHILLMAKEKNINVQKYPLGFYKVCGIIKELSADA